MSAQNQQANGVGQGVPRNERIAQDALGDSAWMGLVDFLGRAKMENYVRGVTVGQLADFNEEFLSQPAQDDSIKNLQSWMAGARKQSEKLASLYALFEQLSKSTQTMQQTLKETMTRVSQKIGYANLPNETLLRILHHVDCTAMQTRENMSLVCRRFRDLIISEPEFWSELNNGLHDDVVDLYLTRSKDIGLSISIYLFERTGAETVEFVRKVEPHCHRWKSFKLDAFVGGGETNRRIVSKISDVLDLLDLPLLREASFLHPMEHEEGDANIFHFYSNWDAPCLETVYFANMFPVVNYSFRLKTISIDITRLDTQGTDWSPIDLGDYLSEQPYVETLELGLTEDEEFEQVGLGLHTLAPFKVPTLRTLRFKDLNFVHASLETVYFVLRCLDMPALEALEIRISDKQLKTKDMKKLFYRSEYKNLKSLFLHVDDVMRYESPEFEVFDVILSKMPNLQHLKLESPDYQTGISAPYRRNPEVVERPPLRTIHLDNCMGVTGYDVKRLLDWIQGGKHWKDFEQIRVSDCQRVKPLEDQPEWDAYVLQKKVALD